MEFVIISGMSGAGKSKVASIMEDIGYFCVDNLPASLIPKFAEVCMASVGEYNKVALVTDVRAGTSFDGFFSALEELRQMGCPYFILYMNAEDEAIVKRYKESRRMHPLSNHTTSLQQAIEEERVFLKPILECADDVIDTTNLSNAKLRGELLRVLGRDSARINALEVRIASFGFKHGLPMDADLVFDVRFLPNPHYVAALRPHTGLEASVRDYVFADGTADDYLRRIYDLLVWLLPRYVEEGKSALVIAIGCTGGHHRSVAVTAALSELIQKLDYPVVQSHRDLGRN